ncbi:hypothetical protein [Snodgrassella alvi]|uniref:Uncharacterized protein n=1 Tax=Snodgrassella alvi TaxID=1196083 RepID=A0A2N9XYA6_9NEIS|nr:hypothetical protein [Snodgrassella alvi]PIT55464.1 hypothetical protein BHC49_06340 [Snodgrassella alvi]
MINELKILEKKYEEIMLSPAKIENDYFQNVMSSYAYKKISKGPSINIKPFDFQQAGFKKGRELKTLPKVIKYTHVYYFDSDNKILLTEIYGQADNIINREYFFYHENCIESIYFESGDKQVRNISLLINKKEHPLYWVNYAKYGYSIWEYIYNDNVLVEIDVECKEHDDPEISYWKVDFEYESGELSKIIRRHPNGYEEQAYP